MTTRAQAIQRQRRTNIISNAIASLLAGGIVYTIVAVAGAPTWADLGFGLVTYYTVVPVRN